MKVKIQRRKENLFAVWVMHHANFPCSTTDHQKKIGKQLHNKEDKCISTQVAETKEFHNWKEFISWKEEEESNTYACFVQPKGETENIQNAGKNNIADTCILSMLYHCMQKIHVKLCMFAVEIARKSHTGVTKTNKTRKPVKLEHTVQHLTTGTVQVRYISTHMNHGLSLQEYRHLPLPQSVKREIQEQFAVGVSLERIIDSDYNYIRASM